MACKSGIVIFILICVTCQVVHGKCVLKVKEKKIQKKFMEYVSSKSTKLLSVTFVFENDNKPNSTAWNTSEPDRWEIATDRHGRYILTSHPDINIFSFGLLKSEMKQLNISVTSEPYLCLNNISEEFFTTSAFNFLVSGLDSSESRNKSVLTDEAFVCHEETHILNGEIHHFHQVCCKFEFDCENIDSNKWQKMLFLSTFVLGIIAFLYAPNIVPGYLYRDRFGSRNFYYEIEDSMCADFKRNGGSLPNASSENIEIGSSAGNDRHENETLLETPRVDDVGAADSSIDDQIYRVKGLWVKVQDMHLVSNSYLPIGLFEFLYRRLVRCSCSTYKGRASHSEPVDMKKIISSTNSSQTRSVSSISQSSQERNSNTINSLTIHENYREENSRDLPVCETRNDFSVKHCCDLPVCSMCCPTILTWKKLLQGLAIFLSSVILILPFVLIYLLINDDSEGRRDHYVFAKGFRHEERFFTHNIIILLRVHNPWVGGCFLIAYGICIILIGILVVRDPNEQQDIVKTLRLMLQNSENRFNKGLMRSRNLYASLFLPFHFTSMYKYGIFALILWFLWVFLIFPLNVVILIFFNTPTVTIVREIIYFCGKKIKNECCNVCEIGKLRIVLYALILIVIHVFAFLAYTVISLLVCMFVYTSVAVFVTAQDTFRYTLLFLLILLNAYDCFRSVTNRYTVFHDKIRVALINKYEDKLQMFANEIKTENSNAEKHHKNNRAIKVEHQSGLSGNVISSLWENMAETTHDDRKNKKYFSARSVLLFLDENNKIFLSEKFFFRACYLDYDGCPGIFATSLLYALRRVFLIFMLLGFILLALNSFGGLAVSNTNGLLLTLSYGLLPFIINRFLSSTPELALDTKDFNFQDKLDGLIKNFTEYWEITNIDFVQQDMSREIRSDAWIDVTLPVLEDEEVLSIPKNPIQQNWQESNAKLTQTPYFVETCERTAQTVSQQA